MYPDDVTFEQNLKDDVNKSVKVANIIAAEVRVTIMGMMMNVDLIIYEN